MKSNILKFALGALMLCTFSLQSFTPLLPPDTTIKVNDLYWTDPQATVHNYYQARVIVLGPAVVGTGDANVTVLQPRSNSEYFSTGNKYYDLTGDPVTIELWVQKTSTSMWEYLSTINSYHDGVTRTVVDDCLTQVEFSRTTIAPDEPIEE